MTETLFIIKVYTFEYYVKFSFWVSVVVQWKRELVAFLMAWYAHDDLGVFCVMKGFSFLNWEWHYNKLK